MMRKLNLLVLISVLFFLSACGSGGSSDMMMNKMAESEAAPSYELTEDEANAEYKDGGETNRENSSDSEAQIERKLIKEGNIRFETNDVEKTVKKIHDAVKKHSAYIANENTYKYSSSVEHTITVRMPAKNFDTFLTAVTEGVDELESKNITVKDVTEEFVDMQARLKTKKQLENRYTELLTKANTVEEILQVERELGNIRTQIESIEGRLKYLKDRVAFSTLTISFFKKTVGSVGFGGKFGRGIKNGWNNLLWFLVGLVNIWPFLLIIFGVTWWLVRRIRKRRAKRRQQSA